MKWLSWRIRAVFPLCQLQLVLFTEISVWGGKIFLLDELSGPSQQLHPGNSPSLLTWADCHSLLLQAESECLNASQEPCCTEDLTTNCQVGGIFIRQKYIDRQQPWLWLLGRTWTPPVPGSVDLRRGRNTVSALGLICSCKASLWEMKETLMKY